MSLSLRNDLAPVAGRALGAQVDSTISPALAAYRLGLNHFMENAMHVTLEVSALTAAFFLATWPFPAPAQTPEQHQPAFTSGELVGTGQQFFGTVSRNPVHAT
jgi:hypothetical protein